MKFDLILLCNMWFLWRVKAAQLTLFGLVSGRTNGQYSSNSMVIKAGTHTSDFMGKYHILQENNIFHNAIYKVTDTN